MTTDAPQSDNAIPKLPREPVLRVNPANLTELKNAVDDHLKVVLSSPQHAFVRSYVHDDVRLALGWTAVGVAAVTGYYSYVVDDFHRTKGWVAVGVAVSVPASASSAAHPSNCTHTCLRAQLLCVEHGPRAVRRARRKEHDLPREAENARVQGQSRGQLCIIRPRRWKP